MLCYVLYDPLSVNGFLPPLFQGRQGPKGEAGDSGLPGQKVSAALARGPGCVLEQETKDNS